MTSTVNKGFVVKDEVWKYCEQTVPLGTSLLEIANAKTEII
jgi:hypothetical protein